MKTYTIDDIRNLDPKPCYDPERYAPEDWTGTLVDILRAEAVPAEDRVWIVTGFLDDRTNRLFAVWCARNALSLIDNPDPRSIAACDIAERYANGVATNYELAAARYAAWYAAGDAAWDAQIQHLIEMIEASDAAL